MTNTKTNKFYYIVIVAILFVLLFAIFALSSKGVFASALTQEELRIKYEFSVDKGNYSYYGATADLENMPVLTIQLKRQGVGAYTGDNRDIRFYYAFSSTTINPLTTTTLSWRKLLSASDVLQSGGIVQYDENNGIATLDFSLDQVTSGHVENSVFNRFVYFKVENTALGEEYISNEDVPPENPLHKQILIDMTTDEIKAKYDFTLNTGGYMSGICVFGANELPDFFVKLTDEAIINYAKFSYALSDTYIEDPKTEPGMEWKTGGVTKQADLFGWNISLLSETTSATENIFHKYMYFRVESEGLSEPEEYISKMWIEVVVDKTGSASAYDIVSVSATYNDGAVEKPYPITNAPSVTWVSSGVRIEVKTRQNAGAIIVYTTFSQIGGVVSESDEFPLAFNAETQSYFATILGPQSSLTNYHGKIGLKSYSSSNTLHRVYDGDLKVYIDKVEPKFDVRATKQTDGNPEYHRGTWSAYPVVYTVTPTAGIDIPSGARYQYLDANGWTDMEFHAPVYRFTATESMSLAFRSVSNSGIEFFGGDFEVQIDGVRPTLNMSVKDGKETEIVSMGATAGPGQRAGYAQNSIRFTLSNTATQSDPRNKVFFEYRTSQTEPYTNIPSSGSNYILEHTASATNPIVNRTYYIRVRTEADDLSDEKQFRVTVLREGFGTEMSVRDYFPTASLVPGDDRAWVNEGILVDFKLPVHLNIEEEYEIYGYITGDTSSTSKLAYTRSEIDESGKAIFTAQINRDINGKSFSFYIFDKARNRIDVDSENHALRTGILHLDVKTPSADTKAVLAGTMTVLGPNDWSAGEVTIIIAPEENISGTVLYRMLSDEQQSTTQIEKKASGNFEINISETGIYKYVLKSGAGLSRRITVPVNIDTTTINFTSIEADLISQDNEVLKSNIAIDGSVSFAQNIRVRFISNHSGHFRYYYATFDSENNPYAPPEAYSLGTGEHMDIIMPIEGGKGEFKYIYYLESRVQTASGSVQRTTTHYVIFRYDVRNYAIEVSGQSDDTWVGDAIEYGLSLHLDGQYEADPIVVSKYQFRLSEGPDKGKWLDVDNTVDSNGNSSYLFRGIKWYFNDAERKDDLATAGETDEISIKKYRSYNGVIDFRAINTAGHPSSSASLVVKIDSSTPRIVYGISQTRGEVVWDSMYNLYHVYSTSAISLRSTDAIAASDPSSIIFRQKAPISYFYQVTTADSTAPPAISGVGWNRLDGTQVLNEAYYWIYAQNALMSTDSIIPYKVHIFRETTALTAEIVSGGTIGASGAYEFNWTDRAVIRVKPNSQTDTYFWYKIDDEPWVQYNKVPVKVGTAGEIRFFGAADATFPEAVVRNFKGTVHIKVTNLAGAEKILDRAVIVKIDVNTPILGLTNIKLSTTENPNITIEDARDRWYPSAIVVEITGNENIPSGVIYQYKIQGDDQYQFMRGNKFSTDDLIPPTSGTTFVDGNGTIKITVQAKSQATQSYSTYDLTFNIDKIRPEFRLTGQEMRESVPGKRLVSGQWTNAPEVVLSREVEKVTASQVTYTFYEVNNPEQVSTWTTGATLSYTLISKVMVKATSQSGLVVEKEFQVNIDSVPPVIHSGIIVNSNDPMVPNVYYIDQAITYTEDNLDYAKYNNFPLSNGMIIATNTVDNSNNGYVHIIVADKAGNKAELKFYMTIFPLTVSGETNSIELNDSHLALLASFENQYNSAVQSNALTESRSEYFRTLISRLKDRVHTLEKQVEDYRTYLVRINERPSFDLVSDFPDMKRYIDYFTSPDDLVRYPDWQQNKIREGTFGTYYEKLLAEYNKLRGLYEQVRKIEKSTILLPAMNIVLRTDYENIVRVYAAYEGLSTDQKAVFSANLFNKLKELKRKCEVLRLQDETTGISIYGDKLVGEGDISIEVSRFEPTSKIFTEVQKTLMETRTVTESRALISLNQIGLAGYGSQYETGEITVTLPIPEEYYNYKVFAVYRLYADGTMSPVSRVEIQKTGRSVSFKTNKLETYALATTANITARPAEEKVYGYIGGVEIDYKMLTYFAYAGAALLAIMIVVVVLMIMRKKKFLKTYNRSHKDNIVKKGIQAIPSGNAPPTSNPARPEERVAPPVKIDRLGK